MEYADPDALVKFLIGIPQNVYEVPHIVVGKGGVGVNEPPPLKQKNDSLISVDLPNVNVSLPDVVIDPSLNVTPPDLSGLNDFFTAGAALYPFLSLGSMLGGLGILAWGASKVLK